MCQEKETPRICRIRLAVCPYCDGTGRNYSLLGDEKSCAWCLGKGSYRAYLEEEARKEEYGQIE